MLKEEIQKNMISSMKSRDALKVQVLRFVISEIKYAEIEKKTDLTDEEVILLLRKEVKKRNEAIEMFKKGNRHDLVSNEEKQVIIIEEYLPKRISTEDLRKSIESVLLTLPDKSNIGRIIGMVMKKVNNQADGADVAKIVKEMLA